MSDDDSMLIGDLIRVWCDGENDLVGEITETSDSHIVILITEGVRVGQTVKLSVADK